MEYAYVTVMTDNKTLEVDKNTTFLELSKRYQKFYKGKIVLACVDNELKELNNKITKNCKVQFLDVTDYNGFRTYQRSISLLMIYAAKEVLGEKTKISLNHSINKNYYCEIPEIELTQEILENIENKMHEIAENDLPIEKLTVSLENGIEVFNKFGMNDTADALKYIKTSTISLYKIGWFYDYLYGPMVPSTGYLNVFKLTLQRNGFILQFSSKENPEELSELKELTKITQVFLESSQWAKILKIDTVGALNDAVCNGNTKDIILISEALHEKKIANIADKITSQKKNIILISGPSSSGKTTFAERICIQLRVNGIKPYIISLDDYYLNRDDTPLDEFGNPNFEDIEAIDIKQFNEDIIRLLNKEKVQIPNFNFLTGKREYRGKSIKLHSDEVLVIEGIHGLNERLTSSIPRENKFKIYISALTQLNINNHNRIATTDTRIIRRIVRDHNFRGFDAVSTIDIWPSVLKGENINIFPFQEEADAMFNSALVYELSVLKQYVEPLLFNINKSQPEYAESIRLIKFLDSFLGINSDYIPTNSIIREFIGGSCFNT